MRGPRPTPCNFPDHFLQEARQTVRRRTVALQTVQRFRLVLLMHAQPDLSNDAAGARIGLSARQVQRWRRRWAGGDFSIDDLPGRGPQAVFSPAGPRLGQSRRL